MSCQHDDHQHHQCDHYGAVEVKVGAFTLFPGGLQYLRPGDFDNADIIVPLHHDGYSELFTFGRKYDVLCAHLPDFGGVTENWKEFLTGTVIPLLEEGKKLLPFCIGSKGRTGTFIASLIALLEPETEDPIAAVRERHCPHAVETIAQGTAIYALRGLPLPAHYAKSLRP